jgi:hypothetical protein
MESLRSLSIHSELVSSNILDLLAELPLLASVELNCPQIQIHDLLLTKWPQGCRVTIYSDRLNAADANRLNRAFPTCAFSVLLPPIENDSDVESDTDQHSDSFLDAILRERQK